ncbi:phosphoribosylglycinamide formyltransferase [Thermostichus vulcanus]|uniref:Phosphoribosylglycinamide formyltransferase n=1 Tax=Thermostichus vulcanus str. 'Rupite' TaxID=2813851 RepID=A0ABT0C7H1_THEVL|nr:phosphoribosylglycinamide formyltransferase [Thermostichus vulcanus]MCJ2541634.1 phosphoribosylglycinamide formyltransferase [Thermostichus vulcanus str. 'Rupite']
MGQPSLLWPDPVEIPAPSDPVRLGILASGNGSNFAAIAQAIQSGDLKAQIAVVITNNPTAYVRQRAEQWGIPCVLLNHREYPQREALDAAMIEVLKQYRVEWVIMAGWMRLVTEVLIAAYPGRILNLHPSLLPSFKGLHAVEQALEYGVKITGCTVHLVTLEMDSGPIVAQAAVPVLPDDTVASLYQRIQVQEHRLYPQAIRLCIAPAEGSQLPKLTGNPHN